MPWERKTVMEQREEFVERAISGQQTMAALCREYGISRKTGYKWLNRANLGQRLCDQSRRPHRQPSKTAPEIEQRIIDTRKENPTWGGRTIKAVLEADGSMKLPSAKTCGNILKRNGWISKEASLEHRAYERFEREACNKLWQTDFKGDFRMQDGKRCFPLNILDDHSRYCLLLEPKLAATGVIESFKLAFYEYGLPDAVLSDHGMQFGGARPGCTMFDRFLMDLDILPIHGRIYHPQTQGKIERFHRTMKAEILRQPLENIQDANRMLQYFRWKYNEVRPHSALGMKTPASVYTPSSRLYTEPKEFVYDYGTKTIKVNNWGYLRFGPIRVFLSESMSDTRVAVQQLDEDSFAVIYRNFQIAAIDADTGSVRNHSIRKL